MRRILATTGFVLSKGHFDSYKLTKAKTPARWQGFFQFQMVARGGIDRSLRVSDPSRDQLVNLVVIPNIDWNNLTLSNDEFKSNSVLQINREAVQPI